MYFNKEHSDTNIDKELNHKSSKKNKKNILSYLPINLDNNKKTILIVGVIAIILLIIILLFINKKPTIYIELIGDEVITLYQGSDYIEPGYKAYNSKDEDLNKDVIIKSNLNIDKIGEYEITYTIDKVEKTRKINIIQKSKEYTYIYLNTINNNTNMYLKIGDTYEEPGYQVFNSYGLDLNDKVEVTGTVDTSKKGSYVLTYSVYDSSNVRISVTRTIIVMDSEINLSLNNTSYTNGKVAINIGVIDDFFDYLVLPNGNRVTKNTATYEVSENGKYTFKVYNKKGISKESSIEVKNIDKTAPTGSCSGYYQKGSSIIHINANDNIGISKYVINGTSYDNKNITINTQMESVNITIYDKSGNTKDISCSLEDKNKLITSDKSITFSYKYVSNDDIMPYGLFTPSNAKYNKKTPLIISLHGASEKGCSQETFKNKFLVKMFHEWQLEGFNAYILFPHLAGKGYSESWSNKTSAQKLFDLIDKLIAELNIDTDKIIIEGHSLGGQGALYMAAHERAYFSAVVPISGYYSEAKLENIKIPIRGYIGTTSAGESSVSVNYMRSIFKNTFGIEKLYERNVSHDDIPKTAFTEDLNHDNKSDLIEWMLAQ